MELILNSQVYSSAASDVYKRQAENGALPYEAVKQLRSTIGNKISEINLVP